MSYLVDTNILARLANVSDAQHAIVTQAVVELHRRGETLHVTPQVLIEFRGVPGNRASRRRRWLSVLSAAEADTQATGFEAAFSLLVDTPDNYPAWKAVVGALAVIGKQVHDARLIAVCHVRAGQRSGASRRCVPKQELGNKRR